jgi:hypothetical protein
MSGPVDVDTVLLATAEGLQGVADGCTNSEFAIQMAKRAQGVRDVHAAVAELIEADRAYDAAVADAKELHRKIAETGWFEVEFDALRKSGDRVVRAQMRRAKALDAIGGAA